MCASACMSPCVLTFIPESDSDGALILRPRLLEERAERAIGGSHMCCRVRQHVRWGWGGQMRSRCPTDQALGWNQGLTWERSGGAAGPANVVFPVTAQWGDATGPWMPCHDPGGDRHVL